MMVNPSQAAEVISNPNHSSLLFLETPHQLATLGTIWIFFVLHGCHILAQVKLVVLGNNGYLHLTDSIQELEKKFELNN